MLKLDNGRVLRPVKVSKHKMGHLDYRLVDKPDRCPSEDADAVNFYTLAVKQWPELDDLMFHVPNERKGTPQGQMRLNSMGVKKGVTDYVILLSSGAYGKAVIELKKANVTNYPSKEQRKFLAAVVREGGFAAVAYGWEAAIHAVNDYLNENNK